MKNPPFIDDVPTKISILHDFPMKNFPPFFQGLSHSKPPFPGDIPLEKPTILVGHNLWPWTLSLHGGLVLKSETHWETSMGHPMTSTKHQWFQGGFQPVFLMWSKKQTCCYLWIIFIFPHPERFFWEFPSTLSVLFVNTGVFLSFCRVIWQAWPSTKMDVSGSLALSTEASLPALVWWFPQSSSANGLFFAHIYQSTEISLHCSSCDDLFLFEHSHTSRSPLILHVRALPYTLIPGKKTGEDFNPHQRPLMIRIPLKSPSLLAVYNPKLHPCFA